MAQKIKEITFTVGQRKATNYSREAFDMNETITLTDTTPTEVDLFRRVTRIKLILSIAVDMIAFNSFLDEEGIVKEDVENTVRVATAQLDGVKGFIRGKNDLENKDMLVETIVVTESIVDEIVEVMDI